MCLKSTDEMLLIMMKLVSAVVMSLSEDQGSSSANYKGSLLSVFTPKC
jgi:hypothetical protein